MLPSSINCSERLIPSAFSLPKPISTVEILTFVERRMAEVIFGYTACRQLTQFFSAIAFFHGSEYVLAVAIHGRHNWDMKGVTGWDWPREGSDCGDWASDGCREDCKALLISKQYVVAMVCSVLEYMLEIVLFPGLKEHWWLSNIGLLMVIIGEVIRKAAILTARRAFTHNIKIHHEDHHEVVTHGIYRFIRHPGYCGFFIWAPATQIMLCNPVCIVAFTVVTWRFFSGRIPYPFLACIVLKIQFFISFVLLYQFICTMKVLLAIKSLKFLYFKNNNRYEEFFLRQFFGSQYEEYARRVPSGVPFVK